MQEETEKKGSGRLPPYDIPTGTVTMQTAERIIEARVFCQPRAHINTSLDMPPFFTTYARRQVYRRGGKLTKRSIMKLTKAVYQTLKPQRNLRKIEFNEDEGNCLHVVGDLHGQIADLLHIIDDAGMPSLTNRYVFNGDFVDRGPDGLEVCTGNRNTLKMMTYVTAFRPGHHHVICAATGFTGGRSHTEPRQSRGGINLHCVRVSLVRSAAKRHSD